MCVEAKSIIIWSGGGCTYDCRVEKLTAEPCPEKPARGIRWCAHYQMINTGSTRKKGPRPGHSHAPNNQGANNQGANNQTGNN